MVDSKGSILDKIKRSRIPEREKRRWTKFVRYVRGRQEDIDVYLKTLEKNLLPEDKKDIK